MQNLKSTFSGTVYRVDEENAISPPFGIMAVTETQGTPSGLAFDQDGVLFIGDHAHQAVLTMAHKRQVTEFIKEYEEEQFRGPTGLGFGDSGSLYFTDSGPLGETSIANPRGSVFCVTGDGQLLETMAYRCLARPSGLAVSQGDGAVYVCETMANRVLRFVKRSGVWHFSVFFQFSGLLGPTAVAIEPRSGNLYVARYDFAATRPGAPQPQGVISVITQEGVLVEDISTPHPELTGLVFRQEGDAIFLYLTESSSSSIYRINIPSSGQN
jgi:sugar lactone lactonase YvrE